MIALCVVLLFLAGVAVDWIALVVLSLTLRRREPIPVRERCPGCAHLPVWLSGCDECGGSGYIL